MGFRDAYIQAIKAFYVSVSTKATMSFLVLEFPWLAHPIIYKFVYARLQKANERAAEHVEMAAFFKYIDVRTNYQGVQFSEAAVNLWQLRQTNATKEEIARAEEEAFNRFKSFAKFNG